MPMIDLDIDLSEEERKVRDLVHKFAAEVMRPAGIALDRLPDPADVIAPQSILWDVFKKYRALGLEAYTDPAGDLAPLQRARLRYIIAEELGWGDAGLAISFGVANFPRMMAQMSGNPELIERFGSPDSIGCWGGTEPHHGSDFIIFADKFGTPEYGRPDCIARKDGDFFVINGQKAAWVSNGTIASASALFCAVDMGDGPKGTGGFVVPLDVPGVTRGKPLDKIGQRALNQGEIFFEDVRIPADYMVLDPEMFRFAGDMVLSQANSGMGYAVRRGGAGGAGPGGRLCQGTGAGRGADLPAPERQGTAVRDVPQGGGGALAGAPGDGVQHTQHPAAVAVRRRFEGDRHEHRVRGRQRGAADLRRQRAQSGIPDRKAAA